MISALERRMRMRLALSQVEPIDLAAREALDEWLALLPAGEQRTQIGVVVDAAGRGVKWTADGPPAVFAPLIIDLLHLLGYPEEVTTFQLAAEVLKADPVGSWIAAEDTDVDAGWSLITSTPAGLALDFLPVSAERAQFRRWLADHPGCVLLELHQSLGEPDPQTELFLAPPAEALAEQLAEVESLFVALQVSGWNADLTESLLAESAGIEAFGLTIAFTDAGVSRVGLFVTAPERRLMLLLAGLTAESADQRLAMLEEVLHVPGPEVLTFVRVAQGWESELVYSL